MIFGLSVTVDVLRRSGALVQPHCCKPTGNFEGFSPGIEDFADFQDKPSSGFSRFINFKFPMSSQGNIRKKCF